MTFKTLREAREYFRRYVPNDTGYKRGLYYNLQFSNSPPSLKFGDWILFQHLDDNRVSQPILGIFTGWKIWDQALVINFVEQPRAWMMHTEVVTNEDINYTMNVNHLDDDVQAIQFWTDDMILLAHWNKKPLISELKQALKTKL